MNYKDESIKYFNKQTGRNFRSFPEAATAFFRMKGNNNKKSLVEALQAYYGQLNVGTKQDGQFQRRGLTTTASITSVTQSANSSIPSPTLWARSDTSAFLYVGSNVSTSISNAYAGASTGNGTQFRIEFFSDSPELDFKLAGINSIYDLYIDGYRVSTSTVTTPADGADYFYYVKLPSSKMRRFSLVGINTGFKGLFTPAGYTVKAATMDRPFIWQLGDSYTYGTGASQPSFTDFRQVCDYFGMFGIADGIGGTGWTSSGSDPLSRVNNKLANLSHKPDFIFLSMAYNDAGGNMTTLTNNFNNTVARIRELVPKARIIVIGTATPVGGTANLLTVTNTIKALCANLVLPYVDMYEVVNSTNSTFYTGGDNVHPNDAGYTARAVALVEKLRPLLVL